MRATLSRVRAAVLMAKMGGAFKKGAKYSLQRNLNYLDVVCYINIVTGEKAC